MVSICGLGVVRCNAGNVVFISDLVIFIQSVLYTNVCMYDISFDKFRFGDVQ